jgi:anthranilate phosphoribosyltransferase
MTSLEYWRAVWTGTVRDERAAAIIIVTAAAALLTLNERAESFEACRERARGLWENRKVVAAGMGRKRFEV